MDMELRFHGAELRAESDGTMTVSGYVNKTGQLSNVLGVTKRFVEKISKGAFTRAIQEATHDIDFLAEHNNKLILASTRNQSLTLREDEQGLFMSAKITPTSWGKDYYELINSGILQNMSFGFRTVKDSWKSIEAGLFERTIDDLELYEVSVVRDPAYSQSTIAARGIGVVEDVEIPTEIEEENRNMENIQEMLEQVKAFGAQIEALTEEVRSLKVEKQERAALEEEKVLGEEDRAKEPTPAKEEDKAAPEADKKAEEAKKEEKPAVPAPQSPKEKKSADEKTQDEDGDSYDEESEESADEEMDEQEDKDPEIKKGKDGSDQQDEDHKKRSLEVSAELAELRSTLNALK